MDELKRMVIFARVVESRSFAGAARRLGIARSAVSRHVSLLEQSLGVRLLTRTTRKLNLTEAGETYYRSCARILAEAEQAQQRVNRLRDEPSGTLRVAGPVGFAGPLASMIHDFAQRHPRLNVELLLDDRVVDMVKEGIDLSVRVGWLADSSLVARRLGESRRLLCASPEYLERHGRPTAPEQLSDHEWIIFSLLPTPYHWTFSRNRREYRVQAGGRLRTNSATVLHKLLLEGAGIGALSRFMVRDDIRAGRLEVLLPDYDCGSAGVWAVWPERRLQPARLALFVEHLQQHTPHHLA